ncbi:hypothetical protein COMNV_00123 [Commensalibacter sp. Nvir]|uniref:dTDP-4-dehydrorhamnose 3,5-epimerase n=1 Tax=Commensalibacter sp. Nvir TaxID=3069817 RepID=UPI002D62BD0A|nr:hypothetical protein COMNV_00123 [Commensalibacter sp. Nvir]
MPDLLLTPLRRIVTEKGNVLHALKSSEVSYTGFGEAYFSCIHEGVIKGWKRHLRMTLNLICPLGLVRFVVYKHQSIVIDTFLGPEKSETYQRLTVPPGYFVGFKGIAAGTSIILNLASIEHDPSEAETKPLEAFSWPS